MADSLLFDGGTDALLTTIGSVGAFGPGTFAAILKPEAQAALRQICDAGADTWAVGLNSADNIEFWNGSTSVSSSPTVTEAAWGLMAVTKATGSVAPKMHYYNGTSWTHTTAGSTIANSGSPATTFRFCQNSAGSERYNGNLLVAAYWNTELSDGTLENLVSGGSTMQKWIDASPTVLWPLMTPAGLIAIIGGCTESSRVGTPTVDTGDVPSWWTNAGMPPYYVGAGAGAVVTTGTTITPAIPSNGATDDILIAILMTNQGDTFQSETGWTQLGLNIDNNANMSAAAKYKVRAGGEGNPTFDITANTALGTSNGLYARVYGFRNVDVNNILENTGNSGSPTSSTTPATTSITTTSTSRLVVSLAMIDDDPDYSSGSPPSTWHEPDAGFSSTTGGDARLDMIVKNVLSAATESSVNFGTLPAADFWRTVTTALIPTPSAAAPSLAFPRTGRSYAGLTMRS